MNSNSTSAALAVQDDAPRQNWSHIKQQLSARMPEALFRTFIEPLRPTDEDDSRLVLIAPSAGLKRHVEVRYLHLIEECLRDTPLADRIDIRTPEEGDQPITARAQASLRSGPFHESETETNAVRPTLPDAKPPSFHLPGHYPAGCNRRELDLLWRGEPRSGVFTIYGLPGSGKTSVVRALVEDRLSRGMKARYMTAEDFLTEFSLSCRKQDSLTWRGEIRSHELLIIDDFQFIKPQAIRSQEELQYIADEFLEQGRLLVLCLDRRPDHGGEGSGLSPGLESRIRSGHRLELAYPEQAQREQILRDAAGETGLTDEQLAYLAGRIQRDMRRLKAAARRLRHGVSMKGGGPGLAWDNAELDQLCQDLYTKRPRVDPDRLLQAVADFFQLQTDAIRGPSRDKKHALARHLTAYLCIEYLQMNLKDTATLIGRREHGTVSHACKKITGLLERDLFFHGQVRELIGRLFADS